MDKYEVKVRANWLNSQEFLVWEEAKLERELLPYAENFRLGLLVNHGSSFFGTFAKFSNERGKEGICFKGLQAMEFFSDLPTSSFITWEWDNEILEAAKRARSLKVILPEGNLIPDYEQYLLGFSGWKPKHNMDNEFDELKYRVWLTQTVNDMLVAGQYPENSNWNTIKEINPIIEESIIRAEKYLDEEHWLLSLGWDKTELPFSIALQIIEPEEDDYWSLKIILQDKRNPYNIVEVDSNEPIESLALPDAWLKGREGLKREINRWVHFWPGLALSEDTNKGISLIRNNLDEEQAWEFLNEGSLKLAEAGVTVWLPDWWQEMLALKPKVKLRTKAPTVSAKKSLVGFDQLISFDWRIALGDLEITPEEFSSYAKEKKRFMKIRDRWIQIDPKLLRELRKLLKSKEQGMSFQELIYAHLQQDLLGDKEAENDEVQIEYEVGDLYQDVFRRLLGNESIPEQAVPKEFNGELRGYQQVGFSWLIYLRSLGLGACLADDMGLGKTIQWIAYLIATRAEQGVKNPALLICPTSVIGNWQKELERFAPNLKVYLHYGPGRSKGEAFSKVLEGQDLVITSYSLANIDQEDLEQVPWESICLDEAQNIKNVYTKQAKAIRNLKGKHRVVLTGTPMENRLLELWSIIDFINPGYLGPLTTFQRVMVAKIEREKDPDYINLLQRLVRPFILRRLKKDPAIELDLPEKEELKEYVKLTMEQASLYEYVIEEMFKSIEKAEAMERRGQILRSLMKLKQICDHPALILKDEMGNYQEERSNKLDRLLAMVREVRAKGRNCLIFTQFLGMGHLIKETLMKELNEKVFFLHGGTPKQERDQMVSVFQDTSRPESDRVGIFVLSLKAGGVGLNLTAANVVFHFDRWWNPAVENQATDRAYRIGQDKDVEVYKFLTLGTLEEKIDEIIEQKQGLNDMIVGTGEGWVTELSSEELREIFALRRQWLS